MATPPRELSLELDNVFLSDVNMDGAADLVQVRFREVDVWLNCAASPLVRLAELAGSAD